MENIQLPKQLIIPITRNCNLDCGYCYQDHSPDNSYLKLPSTIEHWLDLTDGYAKGIITLHGGEPFLVPNSIIYEISEVLKRKHKYHERGIPVQTNATLIDADKIKLIKECDLRPSLSLDGPPELHDRVRRSRSGRGSGERVLRSIKLMQDADIPIRLLCCISEHNINHLEEIYEYFKQLGIKTFAFNCLQLHSPGKPGGAETVAALQNLSKLWLRDMHNQDRVHVGPFSFLSRALISGRCSLCTMEGSCQDRFMSLDAEGRIFPCNRDSNAAMCYGNIFEDDLADIIATKDDSKMSRSEEYRPEACKKCELTKVCHSACVMSIIAPRESDQYFIDEICLKDFYMKFRADLIKFINSKEGKGKLHDDSDYCTGVRA